MPETFTKQPDAVARANAKLSGDLLELVNERLSATDDRVAVIVQGASLSLLSPNAGDEAASAASDLPLIDGFSARLPRTEILRLAQLPRAHRISLDREVTASAYDQNHLRVTTTSSPRAPTRTSSSRLTRPSSSTGPNREVAATTCTCR